MRLIDTAGHAPPAARSRSKLEKLSVADTLRAIRFAEVVVLVVDATQLLERQDLTIARLVAEEGRALVLAVNKWDLVADKQRASSRAQGRARRARCRSSRGSAAVTLSAHDRRGDRSG